MFKSNHIVVLSHLDSAACRHVVKSGDMFSSLNQVCASRIYWCVL